MAIGVEVSRTHGSVMWEGRNDISQASDNPDIDMCPRTLGDKGGEQWGETLSVTWASIYTCAHMCVPTHMKRHACTPHIHAEIKPIIELFERIHILEMSSMVNGNDCIS